MGYGLPKSVEINGEEFPIRYDFRVILDIFEALNDPELDDQERAFAVLHMFYPDFELLSDYNAAIHEMFRFINMDQEEEQKKQKQKEPDDVSRVRTLHGAWNAGKRNGSFEKCGNSGGENGDGIGCRGKYCCARCG